MNNGSEAAHTFRGVRHIIRPMEGGTTKLFQIEGANESGSTSLDGSTSMPDNTFVDTIVHEAVMPCEGNVALL